ncbi:hypothetical protein ACKKBF_B08580 [Auxenochlorella protothecoides x Auxenochlorella symbiontica]
MGAADLDDGPVVPEIGEEYIALALAERQRIRIDAESDTVAGRQEYLWRPPPFVVNWLRRSLVEERDLPAAFMLLNLATTTLPAALLLWSTGCRSHLLGAAYLILTYAAFLQRFMLTLHFTEHRPLFKPGYRLLNLVAPLILAPLLGVPPGMYRLHHCIMHHSGNNRWSLDASSTERYQRDNPLHFLMYWARFALGSWFELPWVAARAGRWGVLAACLACETGYLAGVRWALRASPVAALWTLALPFAVSSLALMLGNWSQHLFLEPAAPRGSLGLAYNCVACADNQRTYNDGYHAVHHLNSKTHWTELPAQFVATLDKQAAAGTLIFRGLGFFDVGVAVFTGNYDLLHDHLVKYTPALAAAGRCDVEAMLRRRLAPIIMS